MTLDQLSTPTDRDRCSSQADSAGSIPVTALSVMAQLVAEAPLLNWAPRCLRSQPVSHSDVWRRSQMPAFLPFTHTIGDHLHGSPSSPMGLTAISSSSCGESSK